MKGGFALSGFPPNVSLSYLLAPFTLVAIITKVSYNNSKLRLLKDSHKIMYSWRVKQRNILWNNLRTV